MYKQAGKFLNSLKGGNRQSRFNTNLVTSAHLASQAPTKKSWRSVTARRPTSGARVYLVRFTLRSDSKVAFLKVGMSGMAIEARFQSDAGRYKVEAIASSPFFSGPDALLVEKSIHRALLGKRHVPVTRLKTGNTECYVYDEVSMRRFADIVNAV